MGRTISTGYRYNLEPFCEIKRLVDEDKIKLPSEELEREMYWKVKENLESSGYAHYEISNFSKKGFESKHNLNC